MMFRRPLLFLTCLALLHLGAASCFNETKDCNVDADCLFPRVCVSNQCVCPVGSNVCFSEADCTPFDPPTCENDCCTGVPLNN